MLGKLLKYDLKWVYKLIGIFYILAFIIYQSIINNSNEYKVMISTIYKKFIINSGLITSWPEAPTLDDYERYRGFSLNSNDMVDESYFRMPNIPTPESTGNAPIFNKYITYNKRKDSFSISKNTFDSYRNFLNFFLLIHFFKNEYMDELGLLEDRTNPISEVNSLQEDSIDDVKSTSDITIETEDIIESPVNASIEVIDIMPEEVTINEEVKEIPAKNVDTSNADTIESDKD